MQVFRRTIDLRNALRTYRSGSEKIGLVPTMGALHEGHISLLSTCFREVDVSVASIFVNPIQFNNKEDYSKYPKSIEEDLAQLDSAGCDYVFLPDEKEVYPNEPLIGFESGKMGEILEGEFRPGHFNGVLLVVSKLLNIVQPDIAYFGQKDLQQFTLISQMVHDCSFPVELRCIETVRNKDGLALSSRNRRLDTQQLKEAVQLYKSLEMVKAGLQEGKRFSDLRTSIGDYLSNFASVKLEYLELVRLDGFSIDANYVSSERYAVLIAAYVGEVRLIDNIILGNED